LPARVTNPVPPAPAEFLGENAGPNPQRRGPCIEDAGAPRLEFDGIAFHGAIPWRRPFFPNIAGLLGYHAPTQQPSWTANSAVVPGKPSVPIPWGHKRIDNFTVRRPFGDTSTGMQFKTGSLAEFVAMIQMGTKLQGRRWIRQSKMHNPTLVNRSVYTMAGSYGQTTATLNTAPTNLPPTSFGVY
jgi:hypothetical protein